MLKIECSREVAFIGNSVIMSSLIIRASQCPFFSCPCQPRTITCYDPCMQNLATIDISRQQSEISQSLMGALQTVGFAALAGHGISRKLIIEIRQELKYLFNRSLEEKHALIAQPENYRGYVPFAFFTPNAKNQPADHYEAYKLHWPCPDGDDIRQENDLYGTNKWPEDSHRLQQLIEVYWQHCERISNFLLETLSTPLGISNDFFVSAMKRPLSNMTLLHYPPAQLNQPGVGANNSDTIQNHYGIHPHKDTDVLTLLMPDACGGLFIKARGTNDWIEAPKDPELMIINVGDMLESWSAGKLVSTPHKVVNYSNTHRYSFPFFAVPRYDVQIEPLVDSEQKNQGRNFLRGTAGDISARIWRSNWPDAKPIDSQLNPFIHD